MPATAVLIPTTSASPFTSAPPLLPGFSAASVWITLSMMRVAAPLRAGSERPSADTTPAVTDPANPCGLPIATTSWPTRSCSASPSVAGCRSRPSVRTTARSESGSLPTVEKGNSRPSVNEAQPGAAAAGQHVRRGQQVAVGGEHDAAAGADRHPAAAGDTRDAKVRDRGREPFGDSGDGAGVRVERLQLALGQLECRVRSREPRPRS